MRRQGEQVQAYSISRALWGPCSTVNQTHPWITHVRLMTLSLADGAIGGTAQKVGGPLDKHGAIGQHFNADGKIGGMVQENLANKK